MQNTGNLYWKNGRHYSGQFDKGLRQGFGVETFESENDFDKFEGTFANNTFNGNGTLYLRNGQIYSGEFKDSFRSGFGTLTYEEENEFEKFEGKFEMDLPGNLSCCTPETFLIMIGLSKNRKTNT